MDNDNKGDISLPKIPRLDTDYSKCIICQESGGILAAKPTTHDKLLNYIHERAGYGDGLYCDISKRFGNVSGADLAVNNATWHRKCYQSTVHVGMTNRAKARFNKQVEERDKGRQTPNVLGSSGLFTRSRSTPYKKEVCFFCEKQAQYQNPLHKVSTENAGRSIKEAVAKSKNDRLQVKLSSAINPQDAVAIDIRYHKHCWRTHVFHALRQDESFTDEQPVTNNEQAAKVEFLSLVQSELLGGSVVTMATLEEVYTNICTENNLNTPAYSRKMIKKLLQRELPDVEFHKAKNPNESELVSIKCSRDAAVKLLGEEDKHSNVDMNCLFKAASILRKAINKAPRWQFTRSLTDIQPEHVPTELYSFFRWIIQGPKTKIYSHNNVNTVNRNAMSLAQTTISMTFSERQISKINKENIRTLREMPQQYAVGIAIRQAIRSKQVVNILHGLGLSVEYNRLLRIETQIANSVIQDMLQHNNVYLPSDVVIGRHVFFAIDNIDFSEDTPDGKNTFHGTAMAIYQRCLPSDEPRKLRLAMQTTCRSINELPDIPLLECPKPSCQPIGPAYSTFSLSGQDIKLSQQDIAWLIGRTVTRSKEVQNEALLENELSPQNDETTSACSIPTWFGYNSLLSKGLPLTRVGTPPLIAAPAHEWSTLLTVLKQAQGINTTVMGHDRKTVITLDMGLYKPAKQLQMVRSDLKHIILRPGELHFVMAQLRTIGSYIENSGLDFCWTEADIYGPATVKQILEGRHVRRGIEAHIMTLQALQTLYQDAWFKQYPEIQDRLSDASNILAQACHEGSDVYQAQTNMVQEMQSLNVEAKMQEFDKLSSIRPMFTIMRQYMHMVLGLLLFIKSVRAGHWGLHLSATELFTKYFFAHDMLNYARMIPVYIAEMASLKDSDADIYEEFLQGNWVVNKNDHVSFCAIGADHALEHVNRSMKVSGGLVGITLNPSARAKFFLIAPELARLAGEAEEMAGYSMHSKVNHHALSASSQKRQDDNINTLRDTILNFVNPFTEDSTELYNLVTKAVMPEKVAYDLCQQNQIGKCLLQQFVADRITTSKTSVWAPLKKCQLQTWKTTCKSVKVHVEQKVLELKENRNLFARLIVVAKSRRSVNLEEIIGKHELSVVPRSLFASDGHMLPCTAKSTLMSIIASLPGCQGEGEYQESAVTQTSLPNGQRNYTVAIIDGMAEVQAMSKPAHIKTCSQLATHFYSQIVNKYGSTDEVHVIFDRYDIEHSLKQATRTRRQGAQPPVAYHITDSTNIAKVPIHRLLSHPNTKMELTAFLGQAILERGSAEGQFLVVAWGAQCRSNFADKTYLSSEQEEADTKILLHAKDATVSGATSIYIYSPDTDVLVLAVRRYPDLCKDTYFVTGTGKNRRTIKIGKIFEALGKSKSLALPGLHALSGCDNTGSFAGKGKKTFWKAFEAASDTAISALISLGTASGLSDANCAGVESFICKVYQSDTHFENVDQLRWWMFRKKQAESERLPPTRAALQQAILRSHYQALVWHNDLIPHPEIPSPDGFGWKFEEGWKPVMTTELPAPQALLQLVRCCCMTKCQSQRCSCRKAGLPCTDLCSCADDENNCENMFIDIDDTEDEELVEDE